MVSTTSTTSTHVTTFSPADMSTSAQFTLAKPVPRHAQVRVVVNRPASPAKQLSARNGSASAPDPHATRTARPPRGTVSKLTIVRVPESKPDAEVADQGGKKLQRRQTTGNGRASSQRSASPTTNSRVSFASTSFSTKNSPMDVKRSLSTRQASPSRMSFANASFAPADRASASRRHCTMLSSSSPYERLAPAQIRELAKRSSRPTADVAGFAPLFMPLEEDIFLPFLDRPTEVLDLLTRAENKKLIALFARMLPPPSISESYYPKTSCELAATVGSWTFEDFTTWLTQVSREEIQDEDWVHALRHFVLPKSEILWERLKGMLGVPPELDVDPEYEGDEEEKPKTLPKDSSPLVITPIYPTSFSSGPRLDEISEIAEDFPGTEIAGLTSEVVGLSITTTPPIPRRTASPPIKGARTVPSSPRSRTPAQGYVPRVSSPLVPKSAAVSQPRPRSAPPQKNIALVAAATTTSAGLLPGLLLSKIRSKDMACPMFPTSFDKLGMRPPTLLRI